MSSIVQLKIQSQDDHFIADRTYLAATIFVGRARIPSAPPLSHWCRVSCRAPGLRGWLVVAGVLLDVDHGAKVLEGVNEVDEGDIADHIEGVEDHVGASSHAAAHPLAGGVGEVGMANEDRDDAGVFA